eukprot:CAMPEP_0178916902 /NCGR_PEP_ID=MMETSP0786-20121207/12924_1 /TAXON_ID=186022 /ORGANISM="Thalassionema frauenfeldii, Strain CCMP 1798" /LENGTH=71 /DNA_ID=CAMNT_0020590343 /DNA_START=2753 /DNA_END=2965 /DNA_ORIENTATION=-
MALDARVEEKVDRLLGNDANGDIGVIELERNLYGDNNGTNKYRSLKSELMEILPVYDVQVFSNALVIEQVI